MKALARLALVAFYLALSFGCVSSFAPRRAKVPVITSRVSNERETSEIRSLLSKDTNEAIWALSKPAIGMGLLRSLYGLTDALWIGRLGPAYLDALGATSFASWIILIVGEVSSYAVRVEKLAHE